MANLILQKSKFHINQPAYPATINWNNCMTKDLWVAVINNQLGGRYTRELVTDLPVRYSNQLGCGTFLGRRYGRGLDTNQTAYNLGAVATLWNRAGFGGPKPKTIVWRVARGSNTTIYNQQTSPDGGGAKEFLTTTTEVRFNAYSSSTDLNVITSNDPATLDATCVLTWSGVATGTLFPASEVHIYGNGKECTYGTQTDGLSISASSYALKLGTETEGTIQTASGVTYFVFMFKRVLSLTEIQEISNYPYLFIKPLKRVLIFPSSTTNVDVTISANVITLKANPQSPTVTITTASESVTISAGVITLKAVLQSVTTLTRVYIENNVQTLKATQQTITIVTKHYEALNALTLRTVLQTPTITTMGDVTVALNTILLNAMLQDPTVYIPASDSGVADVIKLLSEMDKVILRKSEMDKVILRESVLH